MILVIIRAESYDNKNIGSCNHSIDRYIIIYSSHIYGYLITADTCIILDKDSKVRCRHVALCNDQISTDHPIGYYT